MGKLLTVKERLDALYLDKELRQPDWQGPERVHVEEAGLCWATHNQCVEQRSIDLLNPEARWEVYEPPPAAEPEYEELPVTGIGGSERHCVRLPTGGAPYYLTGPGVTSDNRFGGYVHISETGHRLINPNAAYTFHFRDGNISFLAQYANAPGDWKPAAFIRWRKE